MWDVRPPGALAYNPDQGRFAAFADDALALRCCGVAATGYRKIATSRLRPRVPLFGSPCSSLLGLADTDSNPRFRVVMVVMDLMKVYEPATWTTCTRPTLLTCSFDLFLSCLLPCNFTFFYINQHQL